MAIKLGISQGLRQSQKLALTPEIRQSLKVLALSHTEISDLVATEMAENPVLEESVEVGEYREERLELHNKEASIDNLDATPIVSKDDFDWNSYVGSYSDIAPPPSTHLREARDDGRDSTLENVVSRGSSLAEYLELQLRLEELSKDEYNFTLQIIYNIRDDGYLDTELDDLIANSPLAHQRGLELHQLVLNLDPAGCGARNLPECLLAQAKTLDSEDRKVFKTIVDSHLDGVRSEKYEDVARAVGVSTEKIKELCYVLRQLYPRPGHLISNKDINYVVPDVYVSRISGEFVVKVNDEGVPVLRISKLYRSMLESTQNDVDAVEYVKEKLRSAMWLIKSIRHRRKTIYRVAEVILSRQQDFFKRGPRHLKPLSQRDVANELGVHTSTVSRVTSNKYMHTPIGVFKLKTFFTQGVGGDSGGLDISADFARGKIKEVILHENPERPLSDAKIVDLLSREGIKLARRTVAKYREELEIPSSSQRKIK